MRALFVTPVLPSPTGNGLAMRAALWLEALASHFDTDIAVAALFAPHSSAEGFTAAHAASTTMLRGRLPRTPGLPRTVPVLDETSTQRLGALVDRADVVVVFRLYLAGLVRDARVPVVVDIDDLDWVREERLGDDAEAQAYRAYARAMLGVATVVTTAAVADVAVGAAFDPRPTWAHVPNGVRVPELSGDDRAPDIDLLFVATLGYGPNVEAATWLVRDVLPRLPGVRVALVGAIPSADVLALASERVTVAGSVTDVGPWYRRARMCVVPIHSGSGTRTKIPEAWAHRRPVVSTSCGAEGIDVGSAAIIADDAEMFARACAGVLGDAALAASLVAAGTERLAHGHRIAHGVAHALAAVDQALGRAGDTSSPSRIPT